MTFGDYLSSFRRKVQRAPAGEDKPGLDEETETRIYRTLLGRDPERRGILGDANPVDAVLMVATSGEHQEFVLRERSGDEPLRLANPPVAMDQLSIAKYVDDELARPRHQDPLRLTGHGYKVYSQNDEDGIIAEIFNRIGTTDRTFVEFGVETGLECNSTWLLLQGWSGLWIEADEAACESIRTSHAPWLQSTHLSLVNSFVTAETINELIATRFRDCEIDLLSVDIDSSDYWIWKAIDVVRPRVVVVEYNATWRPPAALTVPYDPAMRWNRVNYFGASLSAFEKLGREKGYRLVGCCLAGANAFFVREDLGRGLFLEPATAEEHYEPARYWLVPRSSGHPPAMGPVVKIP